VLATTCFWGDGVDQRTALGAGERQSVQLFGKRRFAQDEAAARTAQRFVRGGGDDIRVRHGAGMNARSNESGNVRHVHKKERANGFCGFADALKINDA